MNFEVMQRYREYFFETNWQDYYKANNKKIVREIVKRADLLLGDQITFTDPLDMEPSHKPYSISEFKWNEFPTQDEEWNFMLSRQGFLVDLAISYFLTKNTEYITKYKELILSFIRENGTPGKKNERSWRPLDTGIRLTNLIKSFTYVKIEDVFFEEELIELEESIKIHIDYLEKSYIDKYNLSNWGVLTVSGMAVVELFFPELVSKKTHNFIWKKIKKQVDLQFYRDGIHWEQSPLYHHQVITAFLYIVQVSKYLDVQLPVALGEKLQKPIASSYYYANNDDLLNPLHDSDNVDLSYIYDIYRYMGYLKEVPKTQNSLLFVGSLYEETLQVNINEVEDDKIFSGVDSGFYAYKDKKLYFTLFNGLHGSSHGHATNGSFTLDVDNQPLIVDSGRYTYMEHPLRKQLKEEEAHNSVAINYHPATTIEDSWAYSSLSEPVFHNYRQTEYGPLFDMAWSGHDKKHNVYIITRTVLYLESFDTFVLYDNIQGSQPFEVNINFNLDPELKIKKIVSRQLEISGRNTEIKLWFNKGLAKYSTYEMSKVYNQKLEHQRITNCIKMDKAVTGSITILSMNSDLNISSIEAYQNNKDIPTEYIEAVKLEKHHQYLELYFLNQDVVAGDKLFKTENQQGFYGRLNIINKKREITRLK